MLLANSIVINGPILKNNLTIWSHCCQPSFWAEKSKKTRFYQIAFTRIHILKLDTRSLLAKNILQKLVFFLLLLLFQLPMPLLFKSLFSIEKDSERITKDLPTKSSTWCSNIRTKVVEPKLTKNIFCQHVCQPSRLTVLFVDQILWVHLKHSYFHTVTILIYTLRI